jgi:curved DNA-binding protein CbpA
MFKDYYGILEISFGASKTVIKTAFKRQALRWHPDRNPDIDTLKAMQDINEAYLILKDAEAKERYDEEYRRYKRFEQSWENCFSDETSFGIENKNQHEYKFHDDILKRWMTNARQQASQLAAQTLAELKTGAKAAGREMFDRFIAFAIIGLIFSLITATAHGCN